MQLLNFLCNLDFWENNFHEESIAKLCWECPLLRTILCKMDMIEL